MIITEAVFGTGTAPAQLTERAAGQVILTTGGLVTVKVAEQETEELQLAGVYVNVTVADPPQAAGAPLLLFVNTPLHPPEAEAVASQLAKAVFTATCVWQAATVVFTGQVSTTVGAAVTVKVALQVRVVGLQSFVYVNITVTEPPQAEGAPVLLLVNTPFTPPLPDARANHDANCVLTADWVWQAATVVFTGQDIAGAGVEG